MAEFPANSPFDPVRARRVFSHFGLIGISEAIQSVYRKILKIAHLDIPVLITGETGTGKELCARSIHQLSPRATGPFVPVECTSLAPGLVEAELFGHKRGAFTGAIKEQPGLFKTANGGTIFLDEVGDLALPLQAKLLRTLQERQVRAVGATRLEPVDVRIVSATNGDLPFAVRSGAFRLDLFFRLNVVQIKIPPLRERAEDMELLLDWMLRRFTAPGLRVVKLSQEVRAALLSYSWPGNVRELANVLQGAIALSNGAIIELSDLPDTIQYASFTRASSYLTRGRLQDLEEATIYQTIAECGGDKLQAARKLGIGKTTLYRKLREYDAARRGLPKHAAPE